MNHIAVTCVVEGEGEDARMGMRPYSSGVMVPFGPQRGDSVALLAGLLTELDDGELMRSLVRGDADALNTLYERYARSAFLLAYQLVGNRETAEDIVQQSFLHAWHRASQFDSQRGTLVTWLLGIVRYSCIDELRSRGSRPQSVTPFSGWDTASTSDVWREVTRNIAADIVLDALSELPPTQRQVIELAYFWGYSHGQIADRLGLPLGTVKGRMRGALRRLQRRLSEED